MKKEDFLDTKWDAREWTKEQKAKWQNRMFEFGIPWGCGSTKPICLEKDFYYIINTSIGFGFNCGFFNERKEKQMTYEDAFPSPTQHLEGQRAKARFDSAIEAAPSLGLYDRVVKALGEREVPISGEDHLVGQIKVDHGKALLLDKVIKEFNIPEGGDVIKWLYNRTKPATHDRSSPRNKYDREILPGIYVDVYDVLGAFTTGSPSVDHAVKKLLAPGQRGVKSRTTDLKEAISSIEREIGRINEWGDNLEDK